MIAGLCGKLGVTELSLLLASYSSSGADVQLPSHHHEHTVICFASSWARPELQPGGCRSVSTNSERQVPKHWSQREGSSKAAAAGNWLELEMHARGAGCSGGRGDRTKRVYVTEEVGQLDRERRAVELLDKTLACFDDCQSDVRRNRKPGSY